MPCSLMYIRMPCSLMYIHMPCSLMYIHMPCSLMYIHMPCSLMYIHMPCSLMYIRMPCSLMYDDKVQSLCRSPSSVHYEISLALAHQTKGKCCATITHRNIFTHVCAYTHMHTYIAISCTVQQKGFSLFWDIYCTYVVEKSIHIRHVPIVVEHFTVRVWTKVGRTFQNGVILPGKKCLANGSFAQIQHSAFCLECSWHKNKCG